MKRKKLKIFGSILIFLSFFSTFSFSQVNTAWVRRYDGPLNKTDVAKAIAVDKEGNVYVTGYSFNLGTDWDWCTIKYDKDGNELWVRRYDGPVSGFDWAYDIAVDNENNIYVTGWSDGSNTCWDYCTIKYDKDGNELWIRRYDGPVSLWDASCALTVDEEGNVYVTGSIFATTISTDYCTIKYDKNGNVLWLRKYDGPGIEYNEDGARAIAVDKEGNVYVTGSSYSDNGRWDYCTIKYDKNGNELWVRRYDGPANDADWAEALVVDNEGNVYVTGYSWSAGDSNYEYCTIKYNKYGAVCWIRRFGSPVKGGAVATGIAIDNENNIYVTGSGLGPGSATDWYTIKYDKDGNELWVRRYNNSENKKDAANALAVDKEGNVYVTGYTFNPITSSFDYCTIKYDQNGDTVWIARYDYVGAEVDQAFAITLDENGNVYVTGTSYGGTTTLYDFCTIKYTQEPSGISKKEKELFFKSFKDFLLLTEERIYDFSGRLVEKRKPKKGVYFNISEKDIKKILVLK